ncbi:MAG: M28 family peptidase [Chloroflexi bacterium]|nr:M28 family peptidase [Chloroflexota bacterium]
MASNLSPLLDKVSEKRLGATVSRLAQAPRHPSTSPAGHAASQHIVTEALREAGLHVSRQPFASGALKGVNLLARQEGSGHRLPPLLVTAHYDTVPGSPGADDNASSIAALLECARVLFTTRLPRRVEYAAFDLEELQVTGEGLLGSSAYVRQAGKGYAAVFNLEMVGYTSGPGTQRFPPGFQALFSDVHRWAAARDFRGDSLVIVCQGASAPWAARFQAAAGAHVPDLPVVVLALPPGTPVPSDVFRSDHAVFWAAGIPAVLLTDTANFRNPHYHTPADRPDTLDYQFLERVTRALVATVAIHAGLGE